MPMDEHESNLDEQNANSNAPQRPLLGIMGIEEKDGDRDALEFTLNVYNLPKKLDTASFFQVHRQVHNDEFELVYESKYQNPLAQTLTFDEASILLSKLHTERPTLKCRLEVFTCKKKSVFERLSARHLGTVTFSLDEVI